MPTHWTCVLVFFTIIVAQESTLLSHYNGFYLSQQSKSISAIWHDWDLRLDVISPMTCPLETIDLQPDGTGTTTTIYQTSTVYDTVTVTPRYTVDDLGLGSSTTTAQPTILPGTYSMLSITSFSGESTCHGNTDVASDFGSKSHPWIDINNTNFDRTTSSTIGILTTPWTSKTAINGSSTKSGIDTVDDTSHRYGMTYSLYTGSGGCKQADIVAADISKIASLGFKTVRVYSTDCNTLPYVGDAVRRYNLTMILGVFIKDSGITASQMQVEDIINWAQWDLVEMIVFGNEAVSGGLCSANDLAQYIISCRSILGAAGFRGICTTTDELSTWQSHGSAWCDVVDVVGSNLHAFFNPYVVAAQAGDFIQAQIGLLENICPGKDVYVLETGWPSAGLCNGKACPSSADQVAAINSIEQKSGVHIVLFSFEDETWKTPGQWGVEQHFGCSTVFEVAKAKS